MPGSAPRQKIEAFPAVDDKPVKIGKGVEVDDVETDWNAGSQSVFAHTWIPASAPAAWAAATTSVKSVRTCSAVTVMKRKIQSPQAGSSRKTITDAESLEPLDLPPGFQARSFGTISTKRSSNRRARPSWSLSPERR